MSNFDFSLPQSTLFSPFAIEENKIQVSSSIFAIRWQQGHKNMTFCFKLLMSMFNRNWSLPDSLSVKMSPRRESRKILWSEIDSSGCHGRNNFESISSPKALKHWHLFKIYMIFDLFFLFSSYVLPLLILNSQLECQMSYMRMHKCILFVHKCMF